MMSQETVMITFMNGPDDGRREMIQQESASIGREADNDIVIDFDPNVAPHHLGLIKHKELWEIQDLTLGSAGIYMNGGRINGVGSLQSEQLVALGATLLKIELTTQ